VLSSSSSSSLLILCFLVYFLTCYHHETLTNWDSKTWSISYCAREKLSGKFYDYVSNGINLFDNCHNKLEIHTIVSSFYFWFENSPNHILFWGLEQILLLELKLAKEHNNFMYILLDIVCKWNISYAKDFKNV